MAVPKPARDLRQGLIDQGAKPYPPSRQRGQCQHNEPVDDAAPESSEGGHVKVTTTPLQHVRELREEIQDLLEGPAELRGLFDRERFKDVVSILWQVECGLMPQSTPKPHQRVASAGSPASHVSAILEHYEANLLEELRAWVPRKPLLTSFLSALEDPAITDAPLRAILRGLAGSALVASMVPLPEAARTLLLSRLISAADTVSGHHTAPLERAATEGQGS